MKKYRLVIYMLSLGVFLTATSELVISGILNTVSNDLNISVALAGQLVTVYSLSSAIGTPIIVSLTSKMNRKKVLLGSLILFVIGCLISALSHHVYYLMIARVLLGISAGVYLVITFGIAAKLVPAEKLGSAISTIVLGFSIALILGVPIGMTIADWLNWQTIFILLGTLCLPVVYMIIRLVPVTEGEAQVTFRQHLKVIGSLVILSGLAITLFKETGNAILYTYLVPYMQNIVHIDSSMSRMIMLMLGIVGAIGARFSGYGVDRFGSSPIITLSLVASFSALLIMPFVSRIPVIGFIPIFLLIFAMFMSGPAIQSYFIQRTPESSNLVLSLNTSVIHVGLGVGSGIGGLALESFSTLYYHPWLAGIILLLGLVAAGISIAAGRRPQLGPAR